MRTAKFSKVKHSLFVGMLLALSLVMAMLISPNAKAEEEPAAKTYNLRLTGAHLQAYEGEWGGEGEYIDITPETTSGTGKSVVNTYQIAAGTHLKALAIPNTAGTTGDDNLMFVGWDWRDLDNRVGEPGVTTYEFIMPDEDSFLWAIYNPKSSCGLSTSFDGNVPAAVDALAGPYTSGDPNWGSASNGGGVITNGITPNASQPDPDLLGMSGHRFAIRGDTVGKRLIRIRGSNINNKNGSQTITMLFKNNHSSLSITIRIFLETYSYVSADSGPITVGPGQVVSKTIVSPLGFINGYPDFAVESPVGGSSGQYVLLDFVAQKAQTFHNIDPAFQAPPEAQFLKIDAADEGAAFANNQPLGLFMFMNTQLANLTRLYPISSGNMPPYDAGTPVEGQPGVYNTRIYVKVTNITAIIEEIEIAVSTTNQAADIFASKRIIMQGSSINIFYIDVPRTNNNQLYFGFRKTSSYVGSGSPHNFTVQAAYNSVFENDVKVEGEGFTVVPEEGSSSPVIYRGNYSFRIVIDDAYNKSQNYTIMANGQVLRAINGVYTIWNMTTEQTITVAGLTLNQYVISGLSGNGYIIEAIEGYSSPVNHGDDFKFTISIAESHEIIGDLIVSVKGAGDPVALTPDDNDVYTISNIDEDIQIIVEGIEQKEGYVTISGLTGQGFSAQSTNGLIINEQGVVSIAQGEDFSFKIILNTGYEAIDGITVTSDKSNVINNGLSYPDTVFIISNVQEAQVITVSGIALINYTINYNLGEGETYNGPTTFTILSDTIELGDASKFGFTFGGWYTEPNGGGTLVERIVSGTHENISVYPKFIPITYTLVLNANSGTYVSGYEPPTTYTILGLDLPDETQLIRIGYRLMGWYDNPGFNGQAFSAVPAGTTGNYKTYYAKWEIINYTITFNLNNGTWADEYQAPSSYTILDDTISLPTDASLLRSGYRFDGWYDNPQFEGSGRTFIIPSDTGDREYWAKWVPIEYTITYEGVYNADNGNPIKYTVEEEITLASLTRFGYTFEGWTTEGVTTPTKNLTIALGSIGNRTFTAHWTIITYTITYQGLNGATNNNPASFTIESDTIVLADPVKEGFVFRGWTSAYVPYPTKNLAIPAGSVGDREFTAHWEVIYLEVSFDSMGGGFVPSQTLAYGTAANTPNTPIRLGYKFMGWYASEDGGDTLSDEPFDFTNFITQDITLYAKWERAYKVSFESNGGSAVGDIEVIQGQKATKPSDPVRAGYKFVGWYTDEELKDAYDWDSNVTEDITLYAKWQANKGCNSAAVSAIGTFVMLISFAMVAFINKFKA